MCNLCFTEVSKVTEFKAKGPNATQTDQRGIWTAKDGDEAWRLLLLQALSSDL